MPTPYSASTEQERLEEKIKLLNVTTWENRISGLALKEWLAQFNAGDQSTPAEQMHALFLLSHFLFFGDDEIRALLRSLYRDVIRAPAMQTIRRSRECGVDFAEVLRTYQALEQGYRFMMLGSASESSAILLYYFRQENGLPTELFAHPHEVLRTDESGQYIGLLPKAENASRYVFLDDLCGSGVQAAEHATSIVEALRRFSGAIQVDYYVLFGTDDGLDRVRQAGAFDTVAAVLELDNSFKVLESESRLFQGDETGVDRFGVRATCEKYGRRLWPSYPLGYADCQLLLGFSHNTPDNTLPIFWGGDEAQDGPWKALFRRHVKVQ